MTGDTIFAQIVRESYAPVLQQARADWCAYQAGLAASGKPADDGDVFRWLPAAARGGLEAQRLLALYGLSVLFDEDGQPLVTMSEALVFARMAAEQGTQDDRWRLATMLAVAHLLFGEGGSSAFAGEAIARLELLADEGHERAAELLASLAGNESPDTLALAHEYRARIRAACS